MDCNIPALHHRSPILAIVKLTWGALPYLLKRSFVAAFDDNCFGIAKGAAYSALLSLFPVLGTVAAILVQTRAGIVMGPAETALSQILPPGTQDVVLEQFRVHGQRPVQLLIVAGVLSLYAAASVVKSLIEGFQAAYRVPRSRTFLRGNAVAMALVLLAAAPLAGASLLIVFGSQIERTVLQWMNVDPRLTSYAWIWQVLSRLTRYAVAFITTTLVTSILYYFGPYRRQHWAGVWPGAVFATILWLLATGGFAWYVRNLANYNVLYGSIGTSIALLVWMYLMAAIALLGCEFNAELERLRKV
jgi:membrane protein